MARILVVEDNESLSTVLRSAIQNTGHNVIEARNGISAVKVIRTEPIDLIITDVFMPGMDGLDLIRETKKEAPDIKIIAMTGGGEQFDEETCIKVALTLGADCGVEKPFEIVELLDRIAELLPTEFVKGDEKVG